MTRRILSTLLLLLLAAFPAGADSTPVPVGEQFQVNTYTIFFQTRPAVAAAADGDFVVVWESLGSSGSDSDRDSIQVQRFDSAGVPVGEQFQVNTYTTSFQTDPAVAAAAGGDFVVVWESAGSSGSDSDGDSIQGQRFDSAGVPIGDEFQINTHTAGSQVTPAVAAAAAGDWVVAWENQGSGSIQGQRFDSAGAAVGDEFQIGTYATSRLDHLAVAAAADGGFVVVWDSYSSSGSDADGYSIQGQRFDSAGAAVGDEFQVNTYTTSAQSVPKVAVVAAGDFVVVWTSYGSSGSDSSARSIQGQCFDSAGAAVGDEFQVNTYTTDWQGLPAVAATAAGDFVAVWRSNDSLGIQGQRINSQGEAVGDEFPVNTLYEGSFPAVAAKTAGEFVVVWQGYSSSGSDRGIQGQRFVNPLFADGFESGDTSAWSGSSP